MRIRTLSAAIAMVLAPAVNAELFISEYVEGSSNNKALEIYNPTDSAINLAGYSVQVFANGAVTATNTTNLSGTVPAHGTFVYVHTSANAELKALANQMSGNASWNGNDAIVLRNGSNVIDSFGQVGVNPGSAWVSGDITTLNSTLRRTAVFYDTDSSDLFDPAQQWAGFAQDDFSDLGQFNGGDGGVDPDPDPEPDPMLDCGAPVTAISAVQGTAAASPLAGKTVQVEAVVTQLLPGLKGYMIQAVGTEQDDDPASSEGVFVYTNSAALDVSVGQRVRLQATVAEYFSNTQLSNISAMLDCGSSALPEPVLFSLPLTSLQQLEAVEGMQLLFNQPLTVNDTSSLGRYGELTLANGRRYTPTQVVAPGAAANALAAEHLLNRIILDDSSTVQNPATVPYPAPALSALNSVRSGDSVVGLTGSVYYSFDEYRIMPGQPVNIVHSNPRTAAPELAAEGNIKVASFNVLNYFNGDGLGGGFPTARGADNAIEFERQRAKIVAALTALDAGVIGLMELENDGFTSTSAIVDLVNGLRESSGNTHWQFVQPAVSPIGTDQITVGLLYRADVVTPVGAAMLLTSANSAVDDAGLPLFDDSRNRPMLAQKFQLIENGAEIAVMVNHLKSKGSACSGDADLNDGQGHCNLTRVRAAQAITAFGAQQFADTPAIVIGDLNSYAKEDPIMAFASGGYSNAFDILGKVPGHGYVFGGLSGQLDHALLNDVAVQYLADATKWNINADEPIILDYNIESKSAQQQLDYYAADAYRSSDHDPVVVSFSLPAAVAPLDAQLQLMRTVRTRFGMTLVQLRWSSTESDLALYRNGEQIRLLSNPTLINDTFRSLDMQFDYQICQVDTTRCTDNLRVDIE